MFGNEEARKRRAEQRKGRAQSPSRRTRRPKLFIHPRSKLCDRKGKRIAIGSIVEYGIEGTREVIGVVRRDIVLRNPPRVVAETFLRLSGKCLIPNIFDYGEGWPH